LKECCFNKKVTKVDEFHTVCQIMILCFWTCLWFN